MSSASRWIRLDTTWSQSSWVSALEPESRLAWVELLCHVKAHGYAGQVKRLAPAVAARMWGLRVTAVTLLEEAAQADGALIIDDGAWVVTGWGEYQSDSNAKDRMRRYRERQQEVTELSTPDDVTRNRRNVTESGPTKTKTVTKTSTYTDAFEEVWSTHARGSKRKAFEAYQKAVPDKIPHEQLTQHLKAYVATFGRDFEGAHLFRWINEERWEEQKVRNGNGKVHEADDFLARELARRQKLLEQEGAA